jgi:hypothetical protein
MARIARSTRRDAFARQADFDEQLYGALKASPWWMVSIATHVLLFVVSTLFQTPTAEATSVRPPIEARTAPPETRPEEDVPEVEDETDPVRPTELVAKQPVMKESPVADHNETANDLPFEDTLGNDALGEGDLEGPWNNPFIGVGGGSGGGPAGLGGRRDRRQEGGGGQTRPTDDALDDALKWLAAHQSADGGWEGAGFNLWCDGKRVAGPGPDGLGKAGNDPGLTGLALLAFLGAGYTNRGDHPFAKVVGNGLRYLKNVQDPEGCFGPRANQHYVYNHAIAALAMVEAYGMTGSAIYKGPAQKALDFIAIARNPYFAWRYGIKPGENDTSVTGWMMMALKSAKITNEHYRASGKVEPLLLDEESFDGIRTWIDKVTDEYGRVGYLSKGSGPARLPDSVDRFPGEKSESMTGVGLLARIFLGEDPRKSEVIKKGVDLCLKALPTWDPSAGTIDMYYWYYASLAMFQVGGEPWKRWNAALKTAVVDTQRKDGDSCLYKGSWDPIDPWGADGGRVYSTATLALCLEVYFRYERVFVGSR